VLAKYTDLTLFVVRQELVSYTEVVESLKILDSGGSQVDGLVYNGFIPSPIRYGYGGYAYVYGYRGYKQGRYSSYQYGYGGKRDSYTSYYGNAMDTPEEEERGLLDGSKNAPPNLDETRTGLFQRSFDGINQLRLKLVDWVLRKNRHDDKDDGSPS
jgi:hypothetical protein